MEKHIDLSIVILSYNTRDLLLKTLDSVFSSMQKTLILEVIVVDNASTNESLEAVQKKYPQVITIQLKKNIGFSAGNNVGIKKTSGKYVLLLNSDVLLMPNTIEVITRFMDDHGDVAVATCKLVFPNDTIDYACHRGFPTPWASFTYHLGLAKFFPHSRFFASYHLTFLSMNESHEIDSPSGAFYFIRRKVIDDVGLLDEDYFMYGEDLDWSFRIKEAGWKIMYVPTAKAIHHKKQSGRKSTDKDIRIKSTQDFYDTMKIFYSKHYQSRYPTWMGRLVFLGIDVMKKKAVSEVGK